VQVRYVDPSHLRPEELSSWEELAAQAVQPNPCAEPAFVIPASRHLVEGSAVRLLVVHDGPRWTACLPVRRAPRWRELPRGSVSAWHHLYCTSTAPLLDVNCPHEAVGLLLDHLVAPEELGSAPPRIFGIDELPEGAAAEALIDEASRRGLPLLVADRWKRAAVHKREHVEDYLSGLSSRRRAELRRRRKRLAERLGTDVKMVDRSDDPDAAEAFLTLEAAGWKGRAGTALACNPDHAAFFRSMCEGFRRTGHLHLWSLESENGRPVAMACRLQSMDVLFTFKIAFDEDYASLGPGVAAEMEALHAFHEREDLSMIDSCTDPANELLNELYPDRVTVCDIAIGLGSPIDKFLLSLFPRVRAARRRLLPSGRRTAQRTDRRAAARGGSISSFQGSL